MKRFNISFKAVSGIERHLKRDSSIRGGQMGKGVSFNRSPKGSLISVTLPIPWILVP